MSYSPGAIQDHLFEYLPKFSNLFTDEVNVSAVIVDVPPKILRITSNNHGFMTGNRIRLINSLLDNGINGVVEFSDAFRFTTNVPHDLTLGYTDNLEDGKIEMQGFTDVNFNGFFDLVAVPSSTTFEIDKNSLTLPVLNGNEVLRENREVGINSILTISNVVDADIFEVSLDGFPDFDTKPVITPSIITGYRIGIAVDVDRAEGIYTKLGNNKLWAYIIMDDVNASKDRNNETDAVRTDTPQNEQRIKNVGAFNIIVFIPTTDQLSAQDALELSYIEIYESMLAVMAGVNFLVFGNSSYVTTLTSHGIVDYKNSYYMHMYSFENVYEPINEDTFSGKNINSVAFRRINISFAEIQDGSNIIL